MKLLVLEGRCKQQWRYEIVLWVILKMQHQSSPARCVRLFISSHFISFHFELVHWGKLSLAFLCGVPVYAIILHHGTISTRTPRLSQNFVQMAAFPHSFKAGVGQTYIQ